MSRAGFVHDLPYGAQWLGHEHGQDRARFSLWAPDCAAVALELDGCAPQPMQRAADGLFSVEASCAPGARYRYRVRADLAVPDPAARAQAGDVHDPSIVVDSGAYPWRQREWLGRPWHQMVIYEIHCGLAGGFDGVRAELPRLAALGITAVELMPIGEFSGARNWGYDGVLPYAPERSYGTPDQLKALIDAAHGLGLCMYLDVVYNHFGPDGNFLPTYASGFFDAEQQSPWGAAIDFRQHHVREFFIHNALYWLNEYRFDGLRVDAVHAIADATFLPELAQRVRTSIAPQRQVHLMLENERNQSHLLNSQLFDAQWNDDAHNALHVLLTGETESYYGNYAQRPIEHLARCLSEGFAYQGEAFPGHDGRPRGEPSAQLSPQAFVFFLQNHDQIGNRALGERLTQLIPEAALHAAVALQLLCPQIPLLFMGEDSGARTPFLFFTDFHDELARAVREGRRKEFSHFAAFRDPARRESIPDPNHPTTFERCKFADGLDAGAEPLALYQKLLILRRTQLMPRLSGSCALGAHVLASHALCAAWQLGDGASLRLAVNLSDAAIPTASLDGTLLYETSVGAAAALRAGQLPAYTTVALLDTAYG